MVGSHEAATGLDHAFDHEHTRKDGEGGEVVLEVLLRRRDVFEGHDAIGGLLNDSIDEVEPHGVDGRARGYAERVSSAHDEGVCIRHWDWSETSQTLSIFARRLGLLRCVAKGSKRPEARFSGGVEILARADLTAVLKPGDAMTVLTSWDLREAYPSVRRSLSAFYTGMAMADIIHHSIRDHDPHPEMYDALVVGLRALGADARDNAAALVWVLWRALVETGHRPEIHRDARSAGELPPAGAYAFSSRLGGLTPDDSIDPDAWRVRATTVELLRGTDRARMPLDIPARYAREDLVRAAKLLTLYFRDAIGSEPVAIGPSLEA